MNILSLILLILLIILPIKLPAQEPKQIFPTGRPPEPWECNVDWAWAENHRYFIKRLSTQRRSCDSGQNFVYQNWREV